MQNLNFSRISPYPNDGGGPSPTSVLAGVVPGDAEQGDDQHGDSGDAKCVQLQFLTRLCSEGGTEPHNQAPADVGGGVDKVSHDDRGDTQYGREQVQVRGNVHSDGGRADPVQAQRGTGRVQAPHVVGGGLFTDDAFDDTVAQDDHCDEENLAPADEGGGPNQVLHARGT